MNTIGLDYETFYDKKEYSIRGLGNWAYTHHPEFDAYLLSVYDGSESWVGHPRDFNWSALEDALLIAHNASFERAVTGRLIEQGIAPTRLLQNKWQCTANMSAFLASSRALDDAVLTLEGRRLGKGIREWMNKKHWSDIVAAGKADDVARYALSDVKESVNLWTKYSHRWPQFERDLSELTMKQCARGVAINVDLLNEYREILAVVIFNLEQSMPWTERGAKPTSPIAIAEQCRMVGIPAPPVKTHDEEGWELWLATYGPKYPWCYSAGHWRQLGKLLSSLNTIKERLRPDNTIDFSLLYFGAHTGRWSGGGSGLNLLNLRKVPIFLKDKRLVTPPVNLTSKQFKEWIVSCTDYALDVRKLLVPRVGKKLIIADLLQIEPRVLNWMAGNWELLSTISGGMNIYEAFARQSMGWKGGILKEENPASYNLSKVQVLELGYGAGWEGFIDSATRYDLFLNEEQSKKIVGDFRENNPLITGLWNSTGKKFISSVGGDFEMELPSGRSLNFRNVRRQVKSKRDPETKKYRPRFVFTAQIGPDREELYGSILVQNATQAIARDVFAGHLLELEKGVGDVLFHVYDEAINEVDLDVTPEDVEHVMSKCPEWLPGCPVAAEAKEAAHYTK